MRYAEGDEVIVSEGQYKGVYGTVVGHFIDSAIISVPDGQAATHTLVQPENILEPLPPEQPADDNPADEEEQVDEVPVYDFGIPANILERHLEWFVGRSLERLGDVGPEQVFFGFQEFEGKAPHEVILDLMGKLEEGAALLAQTHVLLGRIVMALESVHDQN